MTVGELKQILRLVPDEYEAHIEGQEIAEVEMHERTKSSLLRGPGVGAVRSEAGAWFSFGGRKTEGVLNLLAEQVDEG